MATCKKFPSLACADRHRNATVTSYCGHCFVLECCFIKVVAETDFLFLLKRLDEINTGTALGLLTRSNVYWTCVIVIAEEQKTNLMSLAIIQGDSVATGPKLLSIKNCY